MEKTDVTSNAQPENQQINIQEVLEIYSLDELKYQACESHLIGNFDKNKNYKILDIIYPELLNLNKIITEKNTDFYSAFSVVNQTKLFFVVKLERLENSQISATLILQEKLVFGGIYEHLIQTPIKSIIDEDTPNFLMRVREEFHLKSPDDEDQKNLLEDYISPPIELVTELIKKQELLKAGIAARDGHENEYVTSMLNDLKLTQEGQAVVKTFLGLIRDNNLHKLTENKMHTFKQLLDFLIDKEIEKNQLKKETLNNIAVIRKDFLSTTNQKVFESIMPPTQEKPKEKAPEPKPASQGKSSQTPKQTPPKEKPAEKQKQTQGHSPQKPKASQTNNKTNSKSFAGEFASTKKQNKKSLQPVEIKKDKLRYPNAKRAAMNINHEELDEEADFSKGVWDRIDENSISQAQPLQVAGEGFGVYSEAISIGVKATFGIENDVSITVSTKTQRIYTGELSY